MISHARINKQKKKKVGLQADERFRCMWLVLATPNYQTTTDNLANCFNLACTRAQFIRRLTLPNDYVLMVINFTVHCSYDQCLRALFLGLCLLHLSVQGHPDRLEHIRLPQLCLLFSDQHLHRCRYWQHWCRQGSPLASPSQRHSVSDGTAAVARLYQSTKGGADDWWWRRCDGYAIMVGDLLLSHIRR